MITSIGVGPSFEAFFHFESFLITFDWLEKILDRKPAPIEVIMRKVKYAPQCFPVNR